MKKIIYALGLNVALAGALLTSCQTKEQKVEDAKEKVTEAIQDLKDAKQELNAEYPAFRTEADEEIAANQKRIDELREKLAKPGKAPLDDLRKQRIDELEKRNTELRIRLTDYEKDRSDWTTFKHAFRHDADNLKDAFNDFGKDLKK